MFFFIVLAPGFNLIMGLVRSGDRTPTGGVTSGRANHYTTAPLFRQVEEVKMENLLPTMWNNDLNPIRPADV